MFHKIPFTGDVYSEFTQFLVALIIIAILSLAWWTTSIRDYWHVRTVYSIDTRLRRFRLLRRLTNHTVSSTLVESTHPSASNHIENETMPVADTSVNNSQQNKPPEPNSSGEDGGSTSASNSQEEQIIRRMDADDASEIRQRRIAFFENRRDTLINASEEMSSSGEHSDVMLVTSDSEDIPLMEHNYAEKVDSEEEVSETTNAEEDVQNSIRIKLKYLNEELRLVDGKPEELLGDFKRRHFGEELSTNKLVKLIFNGHLLLRDNDTLQHCGFFDNCVVHCLIHQDRSREDERAGFNRPANEARRNRNNRDWDLGNLLILLISFLLSSAWYFRYQYPQFFTVTATVALVTITGIFTVVSVGMFFPDTETERPQTHVIH